MNPTTNQLVEHFFRHESANLVAVLTRAFGIRRIDLVEDMVQVAMLEAMNAWKQGGVPDNPAAWIHRVATNRILDAIRRDKTHEKAIAFSSRKVDQQASMLDEWLDEERLPDSLLRMMFVCCHPTLERKTQIALTLKTLCGFSIAEIARGILLPAETVKKRIQRAKKSLADNDVSLELPRDQQLSDRLDAVHDVLYLMFNEGYSTSGGPEPIRDSVCEEAARLCHLLCMSDCVVPATKALLALFLFQASRLESRMDADGTAILLEDQDRGHWNRELINIAGCWLAESKDARPSRFHLEAAIAMQHCLAPSVQGTDWHLIIRLYTRLLRIHDSPIYSLNRAIAVGQAGETGTAISQLRSLRTRHELKNYLLLDCALGRMHELEGDVASATDAYLAAVSKAVAPHEQSFVEKKLQKLAANS